MQLVYTSHLKTLIQAVLDSGETLVEYEGPGVFYIKVDGTDPAYAEILEKEMVIDDPLDTPAVTAAVEAQAEAQAEAATASAEGDAERPAKRGRRR